jgi:hypothetical protein
MTATQRLSFKVPSHPKPMDCNRLTQRLKTKMRLRQAFYLDAALGHNISWQMESTYKIR